MLDSPPKGPPTDPPSMDFPDILQGMHFNPFGAEGLPRDPGKSILYIYIYIY